MIVTDVRDRGIPWMRLVRRRMARPGTLNLRPAEKVYTGLAAVAGVSLSAALLSLDGRWLIPAVVCLGVVAGGNLPLFTWFAQERGWWFALRTVPLRLLYYLLNVLSVLLGFLPEGGSKERHIGSARETPTDPEALG
jgi:hypothetical protein